MSARLNSATCSCETWVSERSSFSPQVDEVGERSDVIDLRSAEKESLQVYEIGKCRDVLLGDLRVMKAKSLQIAKVGERSDITNPRPPEGQVFQVCEVGELWHVPLAYLRHAKT